MKHEGATMNNPLAALSKAGVSIWLDDLSRERLTSGSLADLIAHDHVVGVTTNPSIFAKAISGSGGLRRRSCVTWPPAASRRGEALRALTTFDVRWACDVLRPVYDATDGVDGRVSIEVDPRLAHDTAATIAEARALWWAVDRPNLFVKIPAARQGLQAIAACLAEGISINVTLIFSLHALRRGHGRIPRRHGTRPPGRPRPVHDRVGRLLLRVPGRHRDRLPARQDRHRRGGRAARHARRSRTPGWLTSTTSRFSPRRVGGAARRRRPAQRPLWASTSVKDPAYSGHPLCRRPGRARRGQHHARGHAARWSPTMARCPPTRSTATTTSRNRCSASCARLGIDYDDVVQELEDDGVAKFDSAWEQLGEQLATTLRAQPARH